MIGAPILFGGLWLPTAVNMWGMGFVIHKHVQTPVCWQNLEIVSPPGAKPECLI